MDIIIHKHDQSLLYFIAVVMMMMMMMMMIHVNAAFVQPERTVPADGSA